MNDLSQEKCVPCRRGDAPLTRPEIESMLPALPGWAVWVEGEHPTLVRQFSFVNFTAAMNFANLVGQAAEEQDHHPALIVEWGKVTVKWWTHALHGLHRNDFIMAAMTDRLYQTT